MEKIPQHDLGLESLTAHTWRLAGFGSCSVVAEECELVVAKYEPIPEQTNYLCLIPLGEVLCA